MGGLVLAAINPDNTPHGYNWTFAFPMLLFIVVAGVLYYLFGRPHRRVPPQPITAVAGSQRPDPSTARDASVAGGLSVAAGGGSTESAAEPHGAHLTASAEGGDTTAADGGAAEGNAAADGESAQDTGAEE